MHPVKVFQPLSQYVSQSDDLARIDYKMREGYIVSEFLRNPQKIQLRYCSHIIARGKFSHFCQVYELNWLQSSKDPRVRTWF